MWSTRGGRVVKNVNISSTRGGRVEKKRLPGRLGVGESRKTVICSTRGGRDTSTPLKTEKHLHPAEPTWCGNPGGPHWWQAVRTGEDVGRTSGRVSWPRFRPTSQDGRRRDGWESEHEKYVNNCNCTVYILRPNNFQKIRSISTNSGLEVEVFAENRHHFICKLSTDIL